MKNKSYFIVGNIPIYKGAIIKGCSYIINTRVKYENSVCSFQFNEQAEPFVFTPSKMEEFELDLSSLIRLKVCLENRNASHDQFFSNTTLISHKKYQKSIYIKFSDDKVDFIFKDKTYEIKSFDIIIFTELIKECIIILGRLQGEYDMKKMFSTTSDKLPAGVDFKVVSNTPPPVSGGYVQQPNVIQAPAIPAPVTTQVIPQAPTIPDFSITLPDQNQ